jgi:hypothetical protein
MYLNFVGALLIKLDVHRPVYIVYQYPSRVKTRLFNIFLTKKWLAIKENEFDDFKLMHMCQYFLY